MIAPVGRRHNAKFGSAGSEAQLTDPAQPTRARNLERATVALIYGPAAVSADYAASLVRGIEAGLRQLGASVSTLNIGLYRREIERIEHERARSGGNYPDDSCMLRDCIAFLNAAPHGKWDYCFGLFHDSYLSDGLMQALRTRCRTVINYPLNLLDQPFLFERALEFCDLTFCSEEEAWDALRVRLKDKVRYVPMAADPDIHRPLMTTPHPPRLLFVGSFYADRLQLLDRCDRELPTSAYGSGLGLNDVVRSIGRELIRYHRWTSPTTALRLLRRSVTRDRHLILSDEEYVRASLGARGVHRLLRSASRTDARAAA